MRRGYPPRVDEPTRVGGPLFEDGYPGRPTPRPTRPSAPRPMRPPRRRGWSFRRGLTLILIMLLTAAVGMYLWADSKVQRFDALPDYEGRPADTPGTNWLLVGSDSREDLTRSERRRLHTGSADGKRTDTIMLLHIPESGGEPVLVSLPRDSYVAIPGRRKNKLNAAFAFGGAPLLARTVEQATDIRIDRYAEIGFGGFAQVVDAVGGVELCPKKPIKDTKAHIDIPAGCQTLDGVTALGYVRARYFDPRGDLGRVERQQEFMAALMDKATSPGVMANPLALKRFADASLAAVAFDQDFKLWHGWGLFRAMKSMSGDGGIKLTVPISDPGFNPGGGIGSAVLWDKRAAGELFEALREDRPVTAPPKTG
ncbi:hypothetical protein TH66_11770 [Carbonactinospora thermoautotrophica]|uniref:Cell envelope-related transcriptional attenuator domain-containing protein n=1 Tax=Carbonactinospora thermoautotrophica TaxID=1469144 RepID=A0A132NFX9_9ACTN|nr:hypothetical protein TH66_11770 [Carbonactinospora thermoautotrophica]KWX09024.1 hypothetical protein TR74_12110 [Carbonactinospora thermoautotrophica]